MSLEDARKIGDLLTGLYLTDEQSQKAQELLARHFPDFLWRPIVGRTVFFVDLSSKH